MKWWKIHIGEEEFDFVLWRVVVVNILMVAQIKVPDPGESPVPASTFLKSFAIVCAMRFDRKWNLGVFIRSDAREIKVLNHASID